MSALSYVLDVVALLNDPKASGHKVEEFFKAKNFVDLSVGIETLHGEKGRTDFIEARLPGTRGESAGGDAPTLGIIGRLGGVGARAAQVGLVSDADGAVVCLAAAAFLAEMRRRGDSLAGDVIFTTHICPDAPTRPHHPAPMMDSPVEINTLLKKEVKNEMDAVLSVDATKANLVVNHTGFAITPTVKEGWILKVSRDLLDIYVRVAGHEPVVVPITMQDLLPYNTPVYHLNSMMQPWLFTESPVVGVAITTKAVVAGSATGATNVFALEQATRFVVEVAKDFGSGRAKFYDEEEFQTITKLHGPVSNLLARGVLRR
ncbi:MAG: DUF1177 domain-containing protein [Candidatus Caldarchaeum sp.]|nr:DUF1177 domain-containing protein [Candidatus Caldarchaeum sp.]